MIKRKVTKAEYAALPEALKMFYKEDGENYNLMIHGDDDPAELRRAKEREVEANRLLRVDIQTKDGEIASLKTQLADTTTLDARKKGDIAALESSWQKKLDDAKAEHKVLSEKLTKHLTKVLVDKTAEAIATELSGDNAHLLAPIVATRLSADISGDSPITRVLDEAGKPSASSLDDLKKELRDNKKYSAIIIASKASGGADSNRSTSRPTAVPKDKKFSELSDAERTAWYKEDPKGFEEAAAANRRRI